MKRRPITTSPKAWWNIPAGGRNVHGLNAIPDDFGLAFGVSRASVIYSTGLPILFSSIFFSFLRVIEFNWLLKVSQRISGVAQRLPQLGYCPAAQAVGM